MSGRQSVRVTYAHKRRRVRHAGKKLLSSPLEVLPPEIDDLTRAHMVRRMLKRSRRAALSDQSEDKNVEHVREHLAKRIKRTQERVSSVELTNFPSNASLTDNTAFKTPFLSESVHKSVVVDPLVPEQLSPVPVAKRFIPRTSSRSLKENGVHSHVLASPFSSRPGSTAPSPKHKGKGRSSRRVSRSSLITKSRTHPNISKEEARRISRKGSTVSLKDANREPPARHVKHQRYLSSPSGAYMRPQFAQEDWIAPPEVFSRAFNDYDEVLSPGGSVHGNASFYVDRPQSCSTPVISRSRELPRLRGQKKRTENLPFFSLPKDPTKSPDVDMMDGTVPSRRQTIHLSKNSIFSSSGEFTIGSLPAINNGGTVESNPTTSLNDAPGRVASHALAHCEPAKRSQADCALTGSFVAEYDISISDLSFPLESTAATKTLDSEDIPKSYVGVHPFSLPGTSSVRSRSLSAHTSRSTATLASPPPLPKTTVGSPSSPASDLALDFRSMDICGDAAHSDGEMHRPSASIRLQTYSRSLRDVLAVAEPALKKSVRPGHARNRAGTIRASDFAKNGVCSSRVASGMSVPSPSNVRRTRSGTIVGPDSKLATKGAPTNGLAAVQSGSEDEDEDEDELLLKSAWIEDLEYLGLAVPQSRKDAEADEMNLGGLWPALQSSPPRRLGLRRW